MTVNITKPGVLPNTIPIPTKCPKCSCEFTFTSDDAEKVFDQRDGNYYKLPCPQCSYEVIQDVKRY